MGRRGGTPAISNCFSELRPFAQPRDAHRLTRAKCQAGARRRRCRYQSVVRPGRRQHRLHKRRSGSTDICRGRLDETSLERPNIQHSMTRRYVSGCHVAFVSSPEREADVYTLDLRTRALRNVTTTGRPFGASWSPDGQWLAFTSDGDSSRHCLRGRPVSLAQTTEKYVVIRPSGATPRCGRPRDPADASSPR